MVPCFFLKKFINKMESVIYWDDEQWKIMFHIVISFSNYSLRLNVFCLITIVGSNIPKTIGSWLIYFMGFYVNINVTEDGLCAIILIWQTN